MTIGQEINDGSVRWIVRDSRAIATPTSPGLMSAADKQALETLKNATGYTLPIANNSNIGGVKTAANTGIIVVASSGVISLAAASKSQLGGIKLDGSSSKFLRGDGTWALPSTAISIFSKNSPGMVPSYDSDQTDLFLTSGGWRELTVPYPSQRGWLTYDGTNQQPEWNVEEGQVTFHNIADSIVSDVRPDIASLASDGSDGREKMKVFAAQTGTNAGYYVVKVTPKSGHIWSTTSSKIPDDLKGTSLPIYTYWKIKKAPNNIDINAKKFEVTYEEDLEIFYDTEDDQPVNVFLPEFHYTTTDVESGLQWANRDAYYKVKNTVDTATGQKKLVFTRLDVPEGYDGTSLGGGVKYSVINPTITLQSKDSYNYYKYPKVTSGKKAMKIQFVHALAPSTFGLSETDAINSVQSLDLKFTSVSEIKILKFSYTSSKAPQISINYQPDVHTSYFSMTLLNSLDNESYYPPVKVETAEEAYLNAADTYRTNCASLTSWAYTSKKLTAITGGSFPLLHSNGSVSSVQAVNDIVAVTSGIDQNNIQIVDRPNSIYNHHAVHLAKGPNWFFADTDFLVKEHQKNQRIVIPESTPADYDGMGLLQEEMTVYRKYNNLTLRVQPQVSSGKCQIVIKAPKDGGRYRHMGSSFVINVTIDTTAASAMCSTMVEETDETKLAKLRAQMTEISNRFAGKNGENAKNYYRVGDYIPLKLNTDLVLDNNTAEYESKISKSDVYHAVLIGIDHNNDKEGVLRTGETILSTHAGHFCICKTESGEDIAFHSMKYNNTNSNIGGWPAMSLTTWLNETFYNALPTPLREKIATCNKSDWHAVTWTGTASNGNAETAINTFSPTKIWLLSCKEIFSKKMSGSSLFESENDDTYEYFLAGNSSYRVQHNNMADESRWWTRTPRTGTTLHFRTVYKTTDGMLVTSTQCKYQAGVCPCFCL